MFHSQYSNGWNSAAAIFVIFKVSTNKTPVVRSSMVKKAVPWRRTESAGSRLYFMKPHFCYSYNISFILADKMLLFGDWGFEGSWRKNSVLIMIFRSSSVINLILLRTKFDTQTTVISCRRTKWFSSPAGLLFQIEFTDCWHNVGFHDKSIVFLLLTQNLGDDNQACYQSTLISGTSFFIQWYFPLSGQSTNEN